jgi:hypothetical protein
MDNIKPIKRYDIKPNETIESKDGEWCKYDDVVEMIYHLSRFKIDPPKTYNNVKFPFGGLIHFFNLPEDRKYLYNKKWEDMTEEEKIIWYNAIPAARLPSCDDPL